jgi:hypothetical protein
MSRSPFYKSLYKVALSIVLLMAAVPLTAQLTPEETPADTIPPIPSYAERSKKWGPNDTIIVDAIWYQQEMQPYQEEEMIWVSKLPAHRLEKVIAEWTRLRNAVYVTYPYARVAGHTINDINAKLATVKNKKQRKEYIKSREKELRKTFTEPLSNLSVYQGRVLMKLINRQTGNNCYEIIKEYKGGMNARLYQTVAFFVGSSLKQKWDLSDKTDRQIENFANEIDGAWYGNPYRK